MARSTAGAITLVVAVGISVLLAAQALAATPPMTAREYQARAVAICTAAHAKLDEQMKAQGVEMIKPPNSRFLVPATAALWPYYKAARRLMAETLTKLRSVAPPAAARARFNHLYGLMAQFAAGREPPPSPGLEFWIHRIGMRERSLFHCTFSLPR
jgi:hypothetical protein